MLYRSCTRHIVCFLFPERFDVEALCKVLLYRSGPCTNVSGLCVEAV